MNVPAPRGPALTEVTWSQLNYNGDRVGEFRGYYAGLIFKGEGFAPGATWAHRRLTGAMPGSEGPSSWQASGRPEILKPWYFEVSTHHDPEEGPLSWRGYEFAVKNPDGMTSNWVPFSSPFDDAKLEETMNRSAETGRRLVDSGDFQAAIEPLRKAMVYSDRLFGYDDSRTTAFQDEWNAALDGAARQRIRFAVGQAVRIVAGPHDGEAGVIRSVHLRSASQYLVALADGREVPLADWQAVADS